MRMNEWEEGKGEKRGVGDERVQRGGGGGGGGGLKEAGVMGVHLYTCVGGRRGVLAAGGGRAGRERGEAGW